MLPKYFQLVFLEFTSVCNAKRRLIVSMACRDREAVNHRRHQRGPRKPDEE
jgi:hypothetical protein